MKNILIYFALFIFSMSINAQQSTVVKIDPCENQTLSPFLLLNDKQVMTKRLTKENFLNLDRVFVFSDCEKKKYEVKGFRLVAVKGERDPIVIVIAGDKISQQNKDVLKHLKGNFTLYFEDIKIESQKELTKAITLVTKVI